MDGRRTAEVIIWSSTALAVCCMFVVLAAVQDWFGIGQRAAREIAEMAMFGFGTSVTLLIFGFVLYRVMPERSEPDAW